MPGRQVARPHVDAQGAWEERVTIAALDGESRGQYDDAELGVRCAVSDSSDAMPSANRFGVIREDRRLGRSDYYSG